MISSILFPIIFCTKIAFLGDSITYGWKQYRNMLPVKQVIIDGKIGANSENALCRLKNIINQHPNKIFIMIGINEIEDGKDKIINNVKKMINKIQTNDPNCYIYIQSILPTKHISWKSIILETNKALQLLCDNNHVIYVDLYQYFLDNKNNLINLNFTNDGLHLNHCGYSMWTKILVREVFEK